MTLLAERGFGKVDFYELLAAPHWDYVIRFKQDVLVDDGAEKEKAGLWVPTNGRVPMVKGAKLTNRGVEVPAVAMVKIKGMKEPWCLGDTKDLNFRMGLRARHIADAE